MCGQFERETEKERRRERLSSLYVCVFFMAGNFIARPSVWAGSGSRKCIFLQLFDWRKAAAAAASASNWLEKSLYNRFGSKNKEASFGAIIGSRCSLICIISEHFDWKVVEIAKRFFNLSIN